MKFCKECGAALTAETRFCKECGAPSTAAVANTGNPEKVTPQQPSKPMNPKTKKFIIAGAVCGALLFGAFKTGEAMTSKERKIEKFESALIEKDKDELADLLVSTDKKLKIDAKSLNGLVKYLNDNPDQVSNFVKTLKDQAAYYDTVKSDSESADQYIKDTMPKGLFNLEKGKGSFLFDDYNITIKPIYISLSTNYDDTVLKVNGKKVATSDTQNYSKMVGPYVPGVYTVEAILKNDYVTLQDKREVYLLHTETQAIDMYLEGNNITLRSEYDDTEITGKTLINGKEINVDPFSEATFGPVVTDGSLRIQAVGNFPWGEMKSEEATIESDWIRFDFTQDEAFQKSIMDTVVLNAREWIQAYTAGDANIMTTYTPEKKEELASEITRDKEYGRLFTGTFLGTTVDMDSFQLSHNGEQWIANVKVKETYNSDYYYGEEEPQLSEEIEYWNYKLVYDETGKKWTVSSYSSAWGFGDENVKEFKETDPKRYTTAWNK
ncbi:zinc ribbon domain-containing protein [Neobacillus sp. SCS-31]|uniref:zinc ribbon domain-containing protein n=1 Tax=Neobacillus oceani TaxID=3115292 RepID=UPI0039058D93